MRIRLETAPGRDVLKEWLGNLPESFSGEGERLFKGRNEIRRIRVEGHDLAVKRFGRLNTFRKIIYLFRKSKARRSFENALRLESLGVNTPAPAGVLEIRDASGALADSYYACDFVDLPSVGEGLKEHDGFDRGLTRAFARFVASLHDRGIIHRDLNAGNVLYRRTGEDEAEFWLIDINRMTFSSSGRPFPTDICLDNLTRFSSRTEMFNCFVSEYVAARKLPESTVGDAFKIKDAHDRRVDRKKKLLGRK